MKTSVDGAKIACLDFGLQKMKLHLGVSVVIDDPEKLDAIRERLVREESTFCIALSKEQFAIDLFGEFSVRELDFKFIQLCVHSVSVSK